MRRFMFGLILGCVAMLGGCGASDREAEVDTVASAAPAEQQAVKAGPDSGVRSEASLGGDEGGGTRSCPPSNSCALNGVPEGWCDPWGLYHCAGGCLIPGCPSCPPSLECARNGVPEGWCDPWGLYHCVSGCLVPGCP